LGRWLLAFAEAEALRRGYGEMRLYTHQTMVGFGDALQLRGDVDAVSENVLPLDQNVAEVDTDAPFHSAAPGLPTFRSVVSLCSAIALDGADHRAELDQHPVARRLHNPAAMLGDERISGSTMVPKRPRRAHLVEPH
jgi:hypothetical protein